MKKNVNLTEEDIEKLVLDFYNYFETGYDFEDFLKVYLEKLGLDEVKVTQKSKDGGIDLTAIRPGVGSFSDADILNYYVQAKCYKPDTTISVKVVRELKGTIPFGNKGILITTAKFSKDAINESNNNPSNPVVLIDGASLVQSCIDYELGFVFTPTFSSKMMDSLMKKEINSKEVLKSIAKVNHGELIVTKNVSLNDIRARIISVPLDVLKTQENNISSLKIKFGELEINNYKYNSNRKFISGVTDFFKKYNLIDEFGGYNSKKLSWYKNDDVIYVEVIE